MLHDEDLAEKHAKLLWHGIADKMENGISTVTLPKVKKEEKKVAKAIEIS